MLGGLCDRRRRLTAVGVVLCLLAAIFAFEAKLAWYSPAGSPTAQISSSKLQAADASRQIAQSIASPSHLQNLAAEAPILLMFAAVMLAAAMVRQAAPDKLEVYTSPSFSGPLFRRPPPKK